MKRPQKRFSKRFEVEVEINHLKSKVAALTKEAEDWLTKRKDTLNTANLPTTPEGDKAWLVEQAHEFERNETKVRKQIATITETKIPNLGKTIAVIQTEVMPFMDGDRSTTVQK